MTYVASIFKNIICEQEAVFYEVKGFNVTKDILVDLCIISTNDFEYVIYFEIDFEYLGLINSEIQINLATKFKDYLNDIEIPFKISKFFENNTYLIISTKIPENISEKELYKEISIVEEDPYFFKKQVFYYTDNEILQLNFEEIDKYCSAYFNALVSDVDRYENYTNNADLEYGFSIKLFEKFPFLKLEIKHKELLNLEKMIVDNLSKTEVDLIPDLLKLSNDDLINSWIESLGDEE